MKIIVTSTGKGLDSPIDSRFGRAAYLMFIDTETIAVEAVDNTENVNLPQGAGIQAAKRVLDSGAGVLITGYCGPKAFEILNRAGVQILYWDKGKVSEAVSRYINGELKPTSTDRS